MRVARFLSLCHFAIAKWSSFFRARFEHIVSLFCIFFNIKFSGTLYSDWHNMKTEKYNNLVKFDHTVVTILTSNNSCGKENTHRRLVLLNYKIVLLALLVR